MLRARASRLGRYEYVASPRRPARTDARQRMSHRFYTSCVSTLAAAGQALWVMLVLLQLAAAAFSGLGQEPNPPVWPSSVHVFTPRNSTDEIERVVQSAYVENGGREDHGQFSADHFAFLFMPGTYHANVPVGFYTQVLGLGSAPSDVVFDGDKGVYCEEGDFDIDIGALQTFWRGAENFETRADHQWTDVKGMLWAVSQAAPLRRLLVTNNLKLYEYRSGGAAGYASGGYLGNSVVRGIVASGSQQQWLTRSSNIAKWEEGVWNMVFVGVSGAPTAHCGQGIKLCQNPYVVVEKAPLVCEKPFISVETTIAATCRAKLVSLCSRAKRASKGNCFVCTGKPRLVLDLVCSLARSMVLKQHPAHTADRYFVHLADTVGGTDRHTSATNATGGLR